MHNTEHNKYRRSRRWYLLTLPLASVLALGSGCEETPVKESVQAAEPTSQTIRQSAVLTPVAAHLVCMVNDKYFGKQQIPVIVEDRTYYGCCEMCKTTLRVKSHLRVAVDPVSGRTVDKALAMIGAMPDGRVYYFENEENLRRFTIELDS